MAFFEHEAGHVDLLRDASETFLQMAEISRTSESNQEIRVFYSHLACNCARLRDVLTSPAVPDRETALQILGHFGSLISETELPPYFKTTEARINLLNIHWRTVRSQTSDSKLDFVKRWLRPKLIEDELRSIDQGLEQCVDKISKGQPAHKFTENRIELTLSSVGEPSFAVWKAARSIFDALLECKQCSCSQPHDFGAKFELGTYRKPPTDVPKHRARRKRLRDEVQGGLDFDMFLSMERHWHEIRVHTVKPRVNFSLPGDSDRLHDHSIGRANPKIETLCAPMERSKGRPLQRLELKLTGDQLFDMGFEKTNFRIDHTVGSISLAECLERRHECFTEKTKRILSLLIGYAVLHLDNTPWLQLGWGSTNIKFFQTTSHEVPLRPFIEAHLDREGDTACGKPNALEAGELDFDHLCPALISLAVVLLEVYFVKPFTRLAELAGIELIQNPNQRISFIDADQVFNGDTDENKAGWRDQIPEDFVYLLTAIDNCLDCELWENEDGQALDPQVLRSRIYKEVIRPLELHLTHGFSNTPLENVDKHAREIDFGQWGQVITSKESENRVPLRLLQDTPTPPRLQSPASQPVVRSPLGQVDARSMEFGNRRQFHRFPFVSYTPENLSHQSSFDLSIDAAQFFDDEIGQLGDARYDTWKSQYMDVYNKFISEDVPSSASKRVKVAILDTGIDENHPSFDAHGDLKGKFNCFDESRKNKVPDGHGHGTFAANLILDYGQDIDLYILKISGKENSTPDARCVTKAIVHAVDEWQVDIISMSFGWPSSNFDGYEDLRDAIDRAYEKRVLMLAAASNSGGHLGRAYPASSPHVICVHSTDALGNRSKFSPTPVRNKLNIATVGESILSAWPTFLCDMPEKHCLVSRSGTSYSTPILVGIVAFLLQFGRIHLTEKESAAMKRKDRMEAVLQRCAERGRDYTTRDGYLYVALSLHDQTLFSKELCQVRQEISQALRE